MKRKIKEIIRITAVALLILALWWKLYGLISHAEIVKKIETESSDIRATINQRADVLETRLSSIESRLSNIETRLDSINRLEKKLDLLLEFVVPKLPDNMKPVP